MLGDDHSTILPRALLVRAFREVLARRQVTGLEVFRADGAGALVCSACREAAAKATGLTLERIESARDEAGRVERYDCLSWWTSRGWDASSDDDDDGDAEVTIDDPDDPTGARVSFGSPTSFGLYRLEPVERGLDEALWIWLVEFGKYDENSICVAARGREKFEQLAADAERRHAAHERRKPGLVVIGQCEETRSRVERIEWSSVLLPAAVRLELESTVRDFFSGRELYRKHKLAYRRGILLAGPPGNGKTTVIRAIRTSANVPVVVASGFNEEKRSQLIRKAFARASQLAPSILCFEDLDAIVDDGPALSVFLNRLDGLEALDGVLVVATTNRPDRIDPAIAKRPSRFDRVFVLGAPDRALRQEYFERLLGTDASPGTSARLAARTDGMSVAFLKEVVVQARLAALRRGSEKLADADLDASVKATAEHVKLATQGLEERGGIGFVS